MDAFQFISAILDSLAWPATVALIVIVFRKSISKVLLTLTKLKYKEMEIDFGRELDQLEKTAKSVDIEPRQVSPPGTTPRDSNQILQEAESLANFFPYAAVSIAWSAVESEIMSAVTQRAISPDYPFYNSPLKNIYILVEHNVIDAMTFQVLEGMRRLRNAAVHSRTASEEITTRQAHEFVFLSKGVVDKLRSLEND